MLSKRFVWRQLASSRKQAVVFVLCVALSMVTLVALGGFSASVNRALLQDARQLQAADIIVSSNSPFSESLTRVMDALVEQERVERARMYEFISVVRVTTDDNSLLSNLKVVEPGYPFYGEVELESGQVFANVLTPGNIIVGPELLDRLGVQVGDPLRVGQATLTIEDVVLSEPDQPVNFFSLGPRIFVLAADLESLD
ncbi:MAG: ABC transporter permease, partial [Anaerolineae bacterium]|nr:ABC transporter permease [Anaerolineae bacterium]